MGHNANTVLMGTTASNIKSVTSRIGTYVAGTAVRLRNDDTLSVTLAHGALIGVSLGKDLSDTNKISICRKGLRVPLKLTAEFSPVIGAVVSISDTTGLGIAAGAGATACNAVYATGKLTVGGIAEDGTTGVDVAYIDFPGGL